MLVATDTMYLFSLCAFVALSGQLTLALNEPSYLITTPNRWIHGRPEMVCVVLHNVRQSMTIFLTLETVWIRDYWLLVPLPAGTRNGTVASSTMRISPTEKSKCISMTLPDFPTDSRPDYLMLRASGRPSVRTPAGYTFSDSTKLDTIRGSYNTDITFMQTDKPIYKPGQLVRIRILTLDTTLRPSYDMIDEIFIETPSWMRVEQWNNITATKGMVQLEFQLHSDPEQGRYIIQLRRNGHIYGYDRYGYVKTVTFEVKEYVLPKYEVTIDPPKSMTFQVERVIAKVCAKYTFGKPVRGTVEGSVCAKERPRFWRRGKRSFYYLAFDIPGLPGQPGPADESAANSYCTLVNQPLVDGCYTINVTRADVGYNRYATYQDGVWLEIAARVKEQGTNQYVNATTKDLSFKEYDIKIDIEGADMFKPGLPYSCKVTAKRLDETPARNEPISIVVNNWIIGLNIYTKRFATDSNGEVKFTIPPIIRDLESYSISAEATAYNQTFRTSSYRRVEGWYSPSGSFVQVIPPFESLRCNSNHTFQIQYTTSQALNTQLHYQVVGLTDIVGSGSSPVNLTLSAAVTEAGSSDGLDLTQRNPCWKTFNICPSDGPTTTTTTRPSADPTYITATHKGTFSVNIPITAAMSTANKLVIYYIRPDGEVVADAIRFKLEECTDNNAQMTFSKSTARPGEPVDIRFSASPQSLCSYGVIDKSVFLEEGNNQLSLSKARNQIQTQHFELGGWTGIYGARSTSHRDHTRQCGHLPVNDTHNWRVILKDSSEGFITAGLSYMTSLRLGTTPCKLRSYVRTTSLYTPGTGGFESIMLPPYSVREFFPETWLWDLVNIDESGSAVVPSTVPDTITEWVGNAVCLNDQAGLGVSEPAKLIAFQPFFVSMRLPYSVIRAEKLPVAVTVNNYLTECMAVLLSMNPSSEYSLDTRSKQSMVTCVCGQDTATKSFTIIFSEIGNINVSITAEVINDTSVCPTGSVMSTQIGMSDTVIRPVVVEPEGSPRDYTVSDFVCMTRPESNTTSGVATADYELPLPPVTALVQGSERAFVRVVGDVMGPALSNIDSLLRMPTGCAEQIMVSFAPNIFVMKYLDAINKGKPDLRKKAIKFMKSGYQRELSYAHNDQSYSSFGKDKPDAQGSLWLTAFVVKCFGLAEPYIFIDKSIQNKSIEFFTKNQDRDGCFPQIGRTHSKYMQGGIGSTQNGTNKAAMTAYVAIAMIEAGVERTNEAVTGAFRCIDSQTYQDGYTASLVSYAYSLYEPQGSKARVAYTRLMAMAKVNGTLTNWKANETEPFEPKFSYCWYLPRTADTETTAYALLTKLNMISDVNTKVSEGLPIVRWLSTQRNPRGGFGSTQDTVIGLQALAAYAELIYSNGLHATITVSEKQNQTNIQVATFSLNDGNSFVEYTEAIPQVTDLSLSATGKGCFLVQTNVRYNINKQDRDTQPFRTTARVLRKSGFKDACKSRQMQVCTQYLGEGGVSNMAIVEVKMVSGWAAVSSSLKQLLDDNVAQLKRYEVDPNGAVQLYFEPLDQTQRCLTIDIEQVFDVKQAKPAIVTTYDYYKTELRQEVEYRIFACTQNVTRRARPIIVL